MLLRMEPRVGSKYSPPSLQSHWAALWFWFHLKTWVGANSECYVCRSWVNVALGPNAVIGAERVHGCPLFR